MSGFSTYLTIQEGVSVDEIETQIEQIVKEHNSQYTEDENEIYFYRL